MRVNLEKPSWPFYLLWLVLPLLCIPLAFVIDLVLLRVVTSIVGEYVSVQGVRHITEDYLGVYLFLPIAGLVIGVLQYWLMRRYLPHTAWWAAATLAGWLLGALLAQLAGWLRLASALGSIDAALLLMGAALGVGQWLVLRRDVPRAGWWVAATIAGWGLVALVTDDQGFGLLDLLSAGLLPAAATALVFAYLMRQMHRPRLGSV